MTEGWLASGSAASSSSSSATRLRRLTTFGPVLVVVVTAFVGLVLALLAGALVHLDWRALRLGPPPPPFGARAA